MQRSRAQIDPETGNLVITRSLFYCRFCDSKRTKAGRVRVRYEKSIVLHFMCRRCNRIKEYEEDLERRWPSA